MLPERPGIVIRIWYRWRDSDRLLYNSYIMLNTKIKTEHYKSYFVSQLGLFILNIHWIVTVLCSPRSLVLPVRVWGRGAEAERGQRGWGEAGVAPVSPLTSVWPPGVRDGARAGRLLDVHPQPVDLPRGGGQVTLQLQLPLTQSAINKMD